MNINYTCLKKNTIRPQNFKTSAILIDEKKINTDKILQFFI